MQRQETGHKRLAYSIFMTCWRDNSIHTGTGSELPHAATLLWSADIAIRNAMLHAAQVLWGSCLACHNVSMIVGWDEPGTRPLLHLCARCLARIDAGRRLLDLGPVRGDGVQFALQ